MLDFLFGHWIWVLFLLLGEVGCRDFCIDIVKSISKKTLQRYGFYDIMQAYDKPMNGRRTNEKNVFDL